MGEGGGEEGCTLPLDPPLYVTVVKSIHELEYRHLLNPRFSKYGEEEKWIFKADRKSNIMGKKSQSGLMAPLSLPCFYKETCMNKCYYSFKIFPRFWLGKTTRIIHHNQPLNVYIEPMTEETWGRGWVFLVVWTKWRNCRADIVLVSLRNIV